jgi:DNA helicase-2/ATP-dependent DNA helicase PcrA
VFLVGLEEGLLPHNRALQEDYPGSPEMEEERRLCYVGMTRAMHRLYLVHCERRSLWGYWRAHEPSRFLLDLPREVVQPVPGRGAWSSLRALTPGPTPTLGRGVSSAASGGEGQAAGVGVRSWSGTGTRLGGNRPAQTPPSGRAGGRPAWRVIEWQAGGRDPLRPGSSADTGRGAGGEAPLPTPLEGEGPGARGGVPRFKTGDRVRHPRFGLGQVLESEVRHGEEEVRVRFEQAGVRLLMAGVAQMELVEPAES